MCRRCQDVQFHRKEKMMSAYQKIIAEIDRFPYSYEDTVEIRARLESIRAVALEAMKKEADKDKKVEDK